MPIKIGKKYIEKLKISWNKSYLNKDNYLLYPSEEVIRFVNKFIYKKKNLKTTLKKKVFLDIGCGAGRHIKYILENGFYCYGVDISIKALSYAKSLLNFHNFSNKQYRLINCNSNKIPLKNNSIDYIIAEAALDSMPTEHIKLTIKEIRRVLKKNGKGGGLLYCSLIKDDEKDLKFTHNSIGKGNYKIIKKHERNTIQVFFNKKKIINYFSDFRIVDIYLVKRINLNFKSMRSRYYLVCQKK